MSDKPHVRWMIRRDMPEVLDIEINCFECPWQEPDFIRALRQRNVIGMVAEYREHVVGFMVYELHKYRLQIVNFAVNPEFQCQGVGREMIDKLKDKLTPSRRVELRFEVAESNLWGQNFLKRCGFEAVKVLPKHRDGEDFYIMSHRLKGEPDGRPVRNRITRLSRK